MTVPPRRIHRKRRDPSTFPPILPEHAQAIGYVASNWSFVEDGLRFAVHILLGIEGEPALAVTAEMSSGNLFDLVHALLFAAREQSLVDEWRSLKDEFETLRSTRNDIVHAEWRVVGSSHYALRIKQRSRVRIEFGEYETAKIEDVANQIADFLGKIDAAIHNVVTPAAAMLRSPPSRPPLSPGRSQPALDLAQARAAKRAKKDADRRRDRKPPP